MVKKNNILGLLQINLSFPLDVKLFLLVVLGLDSALKWPFLLKSVCSAAL